MTTLKAFFMKNYWRFSFSAKNAVKSLLAVFAVIWLATEIAAFFSGAIGDGIKANWPYFFLIGLLWTIWESRPRLAMTERVAGKDATIEIRVGDCFELDGALVIGSNADFRSAGIDRASLQAQFADRYCDSSERLGTMLEGALAGEPHSWRTTAGGRVKTYDIGTVARLDAGGRVAYFTAIAELNEYGKAHSSPGHIEAALAKLWSYLAHRGGMGPLVVPVLGSGLSRVGVTRLELIQTIVRSFLAACEARKFTEKLTIVIHPRDFRDHEIDWEELRFFLRYACKYYETGVRASDAARGAGALKR
ncbi:macro domain-containing protein [Paenibacillus flagellatus]|uniref:Thoeris protein ThsA Macro domain-containing protein n=1 Tax=Paenibacillus flagellatus TaxID=2211139 RepID=A0A2V5KGX8_9BACL|nr:macro domain-containing protein [Paenibacillus flagellatus]PYI53520.1 hypothetical protein DLM86_17290 [Paenibacillus flagellatus]